MERRGRKQEFGFTDGYGRLGSLRRLARGLLRPRRHTLGTSVSGLAPRASDRDRRSVSIVKTNVEICRAQAYQAYLRTQVR